MLYSKLTSADSYFLISGPCAIEDESTVMTIAEKVKEITTKRGIPYVFKASFRKANRSKLTSFTGIGDEKALRILQKVKTELELPVTSDVHETGDVAKVKDILDIIQIPAFLCRQTDLLVASANTGAIVNIKKGQFLSPEAMQFAAQKVVDSNNKQILLAERGTTFGYGNLIVDMTAIPKMQAIGFPVVMDCTHSLQRPNQSSGVTGGDPEMIQTMVNASIASGANGLFIETHPDCANAKSDGANMLPLDQLDDILAKAQDIYHALRK